MHDLVGAEQDLHRAIDGFTDKITEYRGGGPEEHFLRGRAWAELGNDAKALQDYELAEKLSFRPKEFFNRDGSLFRLCEFGWIESPVDGSDYRNTKQCGREYLVP